VEPRKGGVARAASLSPERRKEIAKVAAKARWGPYTPNDLYPTRPGITEPHLGGGLLRPPRVKVKEMTAADVAQLQKCPDCRGHGQLETPATNWNKWVRCGKCHGEGYVLGDE
jgi:hypothetical protein